MLYPSLSPDERLDRTVRYEWLAHYEYGTLSDMQEHVASWMWFYHQDSPRMVMGGNIPKQRLAMAA